MAARLFAAHTADKPLRLLPGRQEAGRAHFVEAGGRGIAVGGSQYETAGEGVPDMDAEEAGEDRAARAAILAEGCEIIELRLDEHAQFSAAVAPLLAEARGTYGQKMCDMI